MHKKEGRGEEIMKKEYYYDVIRSAIIEDSLFNGDVTTQAIFLKKEIRSFKLIAKENGILCGGEIFADVFKLIDSDCSVELYYNDSDKIMKKDIVGHVKGDIRNILKGERVALNFISHLSGIATNTAKHVAEANGKVKITDTRKTIPGLRALQKYAVKCGGGVNHRFGLYDMVLIKDNHIDGAGGIKNAVKMVRDMWGKEYKIEVETRTLDEVKEALEADIDLIMLDNMGLDMTKEALKIINKKIEVEISGNMNIEKISIFSKLEGITSISFGELTHSVKSLDFSLKLEA